VVKLLAEAGTAVEKDQPLLIMEAMKMEHTICAPLDGVVTEFYFQVGEQVSGGEELLNFVTSEDS
jgi:3-methylcrotonyl-CoA carboxylase alpha subunit